MSRSGDSSSNIGRNSNNNGIISYIFSFDAARLLGALLVIVGHSYDLTGQEAIKIPYTTIHGLGVIIFFLISGYLITGSWMNDSNLYRYGVKRFARLWPALAAVVLLTVLILGPLVTSLSLRDYFSDQGTWKYLLRNIVLLPLHVLPGVFEQNPYPVAVNGSLWTLPVEAMCYVLVPLIALFGRAGFLIAFAITAVLASMNLDAEIFGFSFRGALSLFPFFMAGASVRMLNINIPTGNRFPVDLSYGLYLTAFPTQQSLAMLIPGITPVEMIVATIAICTPLAWCSWTFIENPALRFARMATTVRRKTV